MPSQTKSLPSVYVLPNGKRKQISLELKDSASALSEAQGNLEAAQAIYDLSFQRFKAARDYLAKELSGNDPKSFPQAVSLFMLLYHDLRKYAHTACGLGAAIEVILEHEVQGRQLALVEIIHHLKEGGFQFNTASPRRETNAALLKLKGIETDKAGSYWIEDTEEEPDESSEE